MTKLQLFIIQCNDELAFYIESLNWFYPSAKGKLVYRQKISHDAKEKV